ncbi:hypothetical protein ABPG72_020162 [Tetrahymena utriculariae]
MFRKEEIKINNVLKDFYITGGIVAQQQYCNSNNILNIDLDYVEIFFLQNSIPQIKGMDISLKLRSNGLLPNVGKLIAQSENFVLRYQDGQNSECSQNEILAQKNTYILTNKSGINFTFANSQNWFKITFQDINKKTTVYLLQLKLQIVCQEGCYSCTDSANCDPNSCLNGFTYQISNLYQPFQNICLRNCVQGYYVKQITQTYFQTICTPCDVSNCLTCPSSQKCSQCITGYTPNSQNTECIQCPEGCSQCDQNYGCNQCFSGYTISINPINNLQQYCKKNCPVGYYDQVTDQYTMAQQCNPCISMCAQCSSNTQCDTCITGYQYIPQQKKCKIICSSNQFRDSTNNFDCTNCLDNCASCTDRQSCTTCTNGYQYILQFNQCLPICSTNQFRDPTQSYLCQNCYPSCQSCTGATNKECSSCYQGWYTLGSYCYHWCPNNYKEDSSLWKCIQCDEYIKPDCQACSDTCKSCQYKQSSICLDCYDSMQISGDKCACKNQIDKRGIFYECSYNNIAVLQATLAIDTPTLTIDFGVSLSQIQNFKCKKIFQDSTLALFGSQYSCSILNSQIIVQFSKDASIMENDKLLFIPSILSYQISSSQSINIFYLNQVQQLKSDLQKPGVTIQFSETQNTCQDIVFTVANIINDAQRGFKTFNWSISASPSLGQKSLQAVNSIVSNANSQNSTTLVIQKQLIPQNTTITAFFSYLLKVNYSQNMLFSTLFIRKKDIVIKFQTQDFPIYRFTDLQVYISFSIQICDQIIYEPLNIQISSQCLPKLNQNLTQFKYNQTVVQIKKYSIPQQATFDLNVNASLSSDQSNIKLLTLFIQPNISDLLIQIVEGQQTFGFQQPVNLTGLARDFELEDPNQNQGIDLKWDCVSLTSDQNDNKCKDYNNQTVFLQQNISSISIPGSTFSPYQSLLFTFSGSKDTRQKFQSTIVMISETDVPILTVKYQDQYELVGININQDIDVTLLYGGNYSSDLLSYEGVILYNNKIVGAIKFDYYQVRFRIWDYFVNILPTNPIVQVRFSVYNPYFIMPSLSVSKFNINLPPRNCVLSINSQSGQALQTIFNIQMSGCTSANTPISYQFFYYLNDMDNQQEIISPNNILRRQIMDQSIQNQFYTILPSGNLTLMAQAIDSYLAVYNTTIQINVQPFAQNENQVNSIIDQALQINSSQKPSQIILSLCILGEEISKNNPIYNLELMNTRKAQLIKSIISQTNSLPSTSLLSTYANKIIAKLQQSITVQQESQVASVLSQLNIILQSQQTLLNQNNVFMNNNNVFLQNVLDSFKVLNSTTQTLSNNLISQQINLSDQICNYLSQATLPNQGGIQLKGNLISLDCQQISSKNLKSVLLNYKESEIAKIYYFGQTTYSRNPFEQTPEFQNYTQQLKQINSSITITQNTVIKYSINLVNTSANRLLYLQGSGFEQISNLNSKRKLTNINEKQNDAQSNTYIFKFYNLQPSSNNQACLQKQQYSWSSNGCSSVINVIDNQEYYCFCKSTNPTTVTDDLKSLLINKNVKTAFSQDGVKNISNFQFFYEYALVWTLFAITLLQFGLYFYGKNLDKKYSKTTVLPSPKQQNHPISSTRQTLNLESQSIQELNGVIVQKPNILNQKSFEINNQNLLNKNATLKIEKNGSEQKEPLKQDNLMQIVSQPNQMSEKLKRLSKNESPQIQKVGQSEQLQEKQQPQLKYKKSNSFQQVQNNKMNSNKIVVKKIKRIKQDNFIQIESQSNQMSEKLKSHSKNESPQIQKVGQSEQLQEKEQSQLKYLQSNSFQQVQNNEMNSNKIVIKKIKRIKQDNLIQIESQSNQVSEQLKSLSKNESPQTLQVRQSEELQEKEQPQLKGGQPNLVQQNQFQEVQNNQMNSNKIVVSTFQDQIDTLNLINKGIKLDKFELQCISYFLRLPLLIQFKVFHAYFEPIYSYDPDLSRPIKFNIIYLRVVHSLCLSTVFDQSQTVDQQIIISIVSSIIIEVGVFLITIVHKIIRVGQKLSAFLMNQSCTSVNNSYGVNILPFFVSYCQTKSLSNAQVFSIGFRSGDLGKQLLQPFQQSPFLIQLALQLNLKGIELLIQISSQLKQELSFLEVFQVF